MKFKIPAGYRLLRPGSKIIEGDKYDWRYRGHDWSDCSSSVGEIYGDDGGGFDAKDVVVITARPVKTRQPKPKKESFKDVIPAGYELVKEGSIIKEGDKFEWRRLMSNPRFVEIGSPIGHEYSSDDRFDGLDPKMFVLIRPIPATKMPVIQLSNQYNWTLVQNADGISLVASEKS